MDQPFSPSSQAAALRAKAAALDGHERDYCLWLAAEWDKTAARHRPGSPPFVQRRPNGDQGPTRRRPLSIL
jgi:hypothetical protein